MEIAVIAGGRAHHRSDIGIGTSSEAEWRALLFALEIAKGLGEHDPVLIGDAANVIAQANGAKGGSAALLAAFREQARHFARVRVRHVRRGQNLAGIALAKGVPRPDPA